ncbi:ethanolamine kinase 1 [Nasonia vitripennis]|uniref:ethanolamine kinase n=1 Tax=Nasonia vitripennis TaxID=7425 RepID=A0A7M7QM82_NASVI|nr:ethanolamine kinase 1 [Nasonia vitripennis]XP_031783424.1 ethanolamine kinase 1 [Nasonia vitripennis]XP_031783426.1 ethanolamine kinase 1 [Nasonia vitripennis]XP_031783431.1 ethanolamine kinase 1 [Nasonia vitripennis]XP_032451626.1 ethanolamine kinase 1 [Nasonia vitripennis]XP_032451627.1 ethanolamine kinase 1 [Nasonia vitripennis]
MGIEPTALEPHFDIFINENEIISGAKEIVKRLRPSWSSEQLSHKFFTNGISNKLVGIWHGDAYNKMVLIRVYGYKTDLLIDRKAEIRNIRILHSAGHTHSLYATFNNGLAYEFLEGDTLTVDTIRKPEVYKLVAKRMAEMHLLRPSSHELNQDEPMIWHKTEKFMRIMPTNFANQDKQMKFEKLIKPHSTLLHEYQMLKENLSKINSPVVFCHNDLLLGNILHKREEKKVTFIDFEYAEFNYQAFDIANHFAEFAGVDDPDYSLYPDEDLQKSWLRIYLENYRNTTEISEEDIIELFKHVNQFVLMTHFFWGCWALIQSQYSLIDFDFLEYAALRFNEYFRRKQLVYSTENGIRNV